MFANPALDSMKTFLSSFNIRMEVMKEDTVQWINYVYNNSEQISEISFFVQFLNLWSPD